MLMMYSCSAMCTYRALSPTAAVQMFLSAGLSAVSRGLVLVAQDAGLIDGCSSAVDISGGRGTSQVIGGLVAVLWSRDTEQLGERHYPELLLHVHPMAAPAQASGATGGLVGIKSYFHTQFILYWGCQRKAKSRWLGRRCRWIYSQFLRYWRCDR